MFRWGAVMRNPGALNVSRRPWAYRRSLCTLERKVRTVREGEDDGAVGQPRSSATVLRIAMNRLRGAARRPEAFGSASAKKKPRKAPSGDQNG